MPLAHSSVGRYAESTGTPSLRRSQAARSTVEGESAAPRTWTAVTGSYGGWSSTAARSEEHTSELQSLMRISYAVFCLKKKKNKNNSSTQVTAAQEQS